jgi:hypothetical protein
LANGRRRKVIIRLDVNVYNSRKSIVTKRRLYAVTQDNIRIDW